MTVALSAYPLAMRPKFTSPLVNYPNNTLLTGLLFFLQSLSIPVRFIVWSLFSDVSRKWQVKKPDHWLSAELGIAALVFMFSAAVIYFKG